MIFSHPSGSSRRAVSGLSVLGLGTVMGAVLASRPLPAQAADLAQAAQAEPMQRLMQMFTPEIRATLNACGERGQVNLDAGAGANGEVTCGDGTTQPEISLQTYLNTASDFLAASALLGMRDQMAQNPRFTPEVLASMIADPQGRSLIQDTLQSGLVQTGMIAANSDAGNQFTNQVLDKMLPTLQQTNYTQTLLGTQTEYRQVVQSFCTAPGMPIEQAQQTFPGLSAIQLYAICIQESGLSK